jgi:hypothetical protein
VDTIPCDRSYDHRPFPLHSLPERGLERG